MTDSNIAVSHSLPPMPDGLTAGWLTKQLRKIGVLNDATKVVAVTQAQVGDGTGMMSELARLLVAYEGAAPSAELPASFIAKFPSRNPTNREIAMAFNLYEREVRYFAELDPLTEAQTPHIYLSEREGDNFIILMQDLSDYRVGNQEQGADLDDSRACIAELAKLHGAFWNRVDTLDWVPSIADSYHATAMHAGAQGGWQNMCRLFAAVMDPAIAARGDEFIAALPALQARMYARPVTFLHGDFRLDNMLFGTSAEHMPTAIVDWQGPLLGCSMVDVALLLGQSTRTEVRRQHERGLVDAYVQGLAGIGVHDYSAERAWHDYQQAVLYNWVYVAVVAGTLDVSNETAFRWMSKMVQRQVAVSNDLDVFRLMPA